MGLRPLRYALGGFSQTRPFFRQPLQSLRSCSFQVSPIQTRRHPRSCQARSTGTTLRRPFESWPSRDKLRRNPISKHRIINNLRFSLSTRRLRQNFPQFAAPRLQINSHPLLLLNSGRIATAPKARAAITPPLPLCPVVTMHFTNRLIGRPSPAVRFA